MATPGTICRNDSWEHDLTVWLFVFLSCSFYTETFTVCLAWAWHWAPGTYRISKTKGFLSVESTCESKDRKKNCLILWGQRNSYIRTKGIEKALRFFPENHNVSISWIFPEDLARRIPLDLLQKLTTPMPGGALTTLGNMLNLRFKEEARKILVSFCIFLYWYFNPFKISAF